MRAPTVAELRLLPLFAGMTPEQLESVARVAIVKEYAEGAQLFFEGMQSNVLHVILSGSIEIFKQTFDEEVILNTLTRGHYLGEVSFADSLTRSASARAKTTSDLIVITKDQFQKLLTLDPGAVNKLLLHFCKTLAQRLRNAEAKLYG